MGLDVFFSEDIRNALLAANEASSSTAALVTDLQIDDDIAANLRAYRQGFKAALATLALAFGHSPQILNIEQPVGEVLPTGKNGGANETLLSISCNPVDHRRDGDGDVGGSR